jgi:hypothetical protein
MNQQLRGSRIYRDLFLAIAAGLKCEIQVSGQVMILCSGGSGCGTIFKIKPETEMNKPRIIPDVFSRNKNAGTHIAYFLIWFLWRLDLQN